ncbi:FG-GAP-like repeat-containing protein [Archangium lansingense]|uniref:FG-GAP-like repeat-containing protein n=1 Tax=Archangium lansingense TaxID=2995310 RepID=A0ABT3ZY28_9BACT|nr:FG-GAP-like repeat-containing protein [Archangium lansinium]MCY1074312.1 FG-GAP-like repeat-containing protein [Archangium lansinium]
MTALLGDGYAIVRWSGANNPDPQYCGRMSWLTCITAYTVTAQPGGATVTVEQPVSVDPSTYVHRVGNSHAVLTGLVAGTTYTFTVQATNSVGTGPASNTTPPAIPQCSTFAAQALQPLTPSSTNIKAYASVETGDVNGDGRPDVVAVGHSVDVLLNPGDGSLSAPTSLARGEGFHSAVLSDLDGDTQVDLAVGQGDTVRVFRNTGGGTFAAPTSLPVGATLSDFRAADVNGDGEVDLVTSGDKAVRVHLNTGEGSFSPPTVLALNGNAGWLALGDLNGDGKVDLAVTEGLHVSVFLNAGNGAFGTRTTYLVGYATFTTAGPASLELADLDGDGRPELLTSAFNVAVLPNQGDGTFGPKQEFSTGAIPAGQLALGDVNRDGARDVVLVMQSVFGPTQVLTGNLVAVMINDGQGMLGAPIPFPIQPHPGDLAVEDLDGDGRVDIAVVNKASEELGILLPMLWPQAETQLRDVVANLMSPDPYVLKTGSPVQRAMEIFEDERIGAILIVDEGERLVGILSYVDVIDGIQRQLAQPGKAERSSSPPVVPPAENLEKTRELTGNDATPAEATLGSIEPPPQQQADLTPGGREIEEEPVPEDLLPTMSRAPGPTRRSPRPGPLRRASDRNPDPEPRTYGHCRGPPSVPPRGVKPSHTGTSPGSPPCLVKG